MEQDPERFDDKEKRFSVCMVGGMVFMAAAGLLTGPLALAACVIGGSLLGLAFAEVLHVDRPDAEMPPAPLPRREPTTRPDQAQQAIGLEAAAPASTQLWLQRLEHAADLPAAERRR